MCDEVLERSDSGDMLARWERTLMLVPLDPRTNTFRIHRVLRDVLYDTFERRDPNGRRRVDSAEQCTSDRSTLDRAIQLAVRAGHVDRAMRLVDIFAPKYVTAAEHPTVNRWLSWLSNETNLERHTLRDRLDGRAEFRQP